MSVCIIIDTISSKRSWALDLFTMHIKYNKYFLEMQVLIIMCITDKTMREVITFPS